MVEFIAQLSDYQVVKKDAVLWNKPQ